MYNKITHVASKFNGVIYSLPRPKRHSDVWVMMNQLGVDVTFNMDERGFLDEAGVWLTRSGAYYPAQRTGQLKVDKEWTQNHPHKLKAGILYSEDIW